jgi:2-polyprenyl-3-methyl-5-hydroxy-6-metoxy-1,4-benzoquinol methylase
MPRPAALSPDASPEHTEAVDECCVPRTPGGYDEVFDARFARKLARRYERRGPTKPEQVVIDFASSLGLTGATVLEVGGGIGEIQLELLRRGAAHTTNLELSRQYEPEAARLARAAGRQTSITRFVGIDIAVDPASVAPADIVVLNRVVCCYPDYDRLLSASAALARRAVVFSHPPRTLLTRALGVLANAGMRLTRHTCRGFVHPPQAMIDVLARHGFAADYRRRAGLWAVVGAVRS